MPGLLMKSFFGITPRDEISQVIGQWLLHVCRGLQNVEVGLSSRHVPIDVFLTERSYRF
jgi:hypothetical protein